jgi:hypothetical protein
MSVAAADLNGDGRPDLAAGGRHGVSVRLGRGDGSFAPPTNYNAGVSAISVAVGDLNADGRPDLAVADVDSNQVSVLLSRGFLPLRLKVAGISDRRCLRAAVRARVRVRGVSPLRFVNALLDGKRVAHTRRARFGLTLHLERLRPGPHSLRLRARDASGGQASLVVHFHRCRSRTAEAG